MENLVSHEAMVNEIKNLCWDNSVVAEILMVYLKKYKKGC